MTHIQPHVLIGLFGLGTAVVAGAAVGQMVGLRPDEGAYLAVLLLALAGWGIGRSTRYRDRP